MTRKALFAAPALALLVAAVALAGSSLAAAGSTDLTERRSADVKAVSPETLAPTVTGRDWREVQVSASKIGR